MAGFFKKVGATPKRVVQDLKGLMETTAAALAAALTRRDENAYIRPKR